MSPGKSITFTLYLDLKVGLQYLLRYLPNAVKIFACVFSRPTLKKKPFPASSDSPPNSSFPSCRLLYIPYTCWPMSIPPFHLAHELLLHYLSIHLQPPTCHPHFFCANYHWRRITLLCPLTLVPGCWSTRDPRPLAAVLVCHKSLSGTSVIDGPRRAALTHPASARGGMAWGSIDYDAVCDRGESKMSWWWQRKTKETTLWMRCCWLMWWDLICALLIIAEISSSMIYKHTAGK